MRAVLLLLAQGLLVFRLLHIVLVMDLRSQSLKQRGEIIWGVSGV